jgi:hypothetical protein
MLTPADANTEDEWYDTTTSEDCTPVKSNTARGVEPSSPRSRYQTRISQMSETQNGTLITPRPFYCMNVLTVISTTVPSLFDTALPPCNADVQIAYQIVNSRLRTRWLEMHNSGSLATTRAPLVAVCRSVSRELKEQQRLWQNGKRLVKNRKPWCRESVFQYELRWIDYFIREAKAMVPVLLTESEMLDKKSNMPDVPPELEFDKLKRFVPGYVLVLWHAWNEKKRAGTPASRLAVPEIQNGGQRGGGPDTMQTKIENESKEGPSQDTTSHETPTPRAGGSENDAHYWSEGVHD